MRTFLLLIILSFYALSCKSPVEEKLVTEDVTNVKKVEIIPLKITDLDSSKLKINYKAKGDYTEIKEKMKTERDYFKILYASDTEKAIDSAGGYLNSKLLNDIVPHWYNTTWDFNGHTDIPGEGDIACGYFVSTTLKHLGFNLNRYKMAQQAGLNIAKALQPKSELKIFSNLSFEDLKRKVNLNYNDGIYFIGLDNHVGYVLIKDEELYFLHSSYCDDRVMIELAKTSPCFVSNIYVIAEITTNKELVRKWITNEQLIIPTE